MDLYRVTRDLPGDRSTDGPLWDSVWFICGTDRPMVPYEVTCDSSVGPIDRWSFMR